MLLKSKAKVNIGLQIRDRRPDGYHTIHTLFQELDFHDIITLEKRESGCGFSSNVDWLKNDDSNLCVKAWRKMVDVFGIGGISIQLEKRIPAGGGLGGGSSNAATVLKGLRQLYELDLSDDELESLSVDLGADVPFFIRGGLQSGDGIGEVLKPLKPRIDGCFLCVVPDLYIDTKWAYGQVKNILDKPKDLVNFAGFIQKVNIPFELFENDFEAIVVPAYPEIGHIKNSLRAHGARFASLSGSGSTVYGIFDEEVDAKLAKSQIFSQYNTFITYSNL
ncbi:MAG: 4-(cytidine 5'-diphospho)-2-C-methyl-D-erythritol kinase [Candidatus Marinimicrobia bacterium]|mgnify:FL=1|nr:4-(cytidine 5'-diphospho)-2-C-methyl-D-erythritol kinase [Candidatus Neomarinimicrobiota bacterium]MBT7945390.1 4-(cytidine 5'-diphospho)-2-C-methyl-D-erythritol kinase [Candidatus Neomarinimicrobiota bacterium]